MKKFVVRLFVAATLASSLMIWAPKAQAYGYGGGGYGSDQGWEINPELMYYFYTQNFGTSNNNLTYSRTLGTIEAAYHWNLFHLGGQYIYDQFQTSGGSTTSTDTYGSYGIDVGLETDGIYLFFTYLIGSTGTLSQGTPQAFTWNSGSGYQVQLGYQFQLGSGWSVGPELDYRSITYPSQQNKQNNYVFTTFAPYVAFHYKF